MVVDVGLHRVGIFAARLVLRLGWHVFCACCLYLYCGDCGVGLFYFYDFVSV